MKDDKTPAPTPSVDLEFATVDQIFAEIKKRCSTAVLLIESPTEDRTLSHGAPYSVVGMLRVAEQIYSGDLVRQVQDDTRGEEEKESDS